MNLRRLPYHFQIPLGLALAVVVAALLVTVIAARIGAKSAREATLETVDRAVSLLTAQSRPLLAADDTWRAFALLRNTAALLPGADAGHARAAVLDAQGRVFAASEPERLETGERLLTERFEATLMSRAGETEARLVNDVGAVFRLTAPVRSEDGQLQGFVYVEVDPVVFAPDWAALSKPALIGALLAVIVLVPVGWWIGREMARPVESVARFIGRIGSEAPAELQRQVPRMHDRELHRISDAMSRLLEEMQVRQAAEQRALSAERMAAVGRLTGAVAHEINNPLGGLLTATQTLRLHGANDSTRTQAVNLIERGLQQIRTTVAALVPQARIEDRPLEANDLADVVTLVLSLASRLGVTVRSRTEIAAPLKVPSAPFRQVMLNLLLNAVKAAGENGWVDAVLEADHAAVRFNVSNSGERLSADALERRIAAESGNDPRGFGLWVCREIATQFGGGFEVAGSDEPITNLLVWVPNRVVGSDAEQGDR